jgi:hypothetical protein
MINVDYEEIFGFEKIAGAKIRPQDGGYVGFVHYDCQ